MMGLKIDMMVEHIKNHKKDWPEIPKEVLRFYLKDKFKCSSYMANEAIKKLFES